MLTEEPHFTNARVPDPGIRAVLGPRNRRQCWLDVEAALAHAQAELGLVPPDAAEAIARCADLQLLDLDRLGDRAATMSHPLMPLIIELAESVGEPHGGWVHWGATTQNITQTGDVLAVRESHRILMELLDRVLGVAADLAERTADTVMAGRTHGQHALPITLGFKVATWLDQLIRHSARMRRVEGDLFTAMTGGAVGTFASLGELGPEVQERVAARLGLRPMPVPGRGIADHFADYVCTLGLLSATCGAVARSVHTMMQTEFGEVLEPVPPGTVGSSTMPHKVNPQLSDRVAVLAARVRALVPTALEALNQDHEADSAHSELIDGAVRDAAVLTGDVLAYLEVILGGLTFDEVRLRANLDLSEGMVGSEAVMLALGAEIGRQRAHEVVTRAARSAVPGGVTFAELLSADPEVRAHVSPERLADLLNPVRQVGLSATIARETAKRAREVAGRRETRCIVRGLSMG